ncbi:MAG: hypothetical protein IKF82_01015 [Bacilli bacterium]|nr:hypothetical protein [Bacilli bacterium]
MRELDFSKRNIDGDPEIVFAGLKDCIIYMRKSQVEALANYCYLDLKNNVYVYPLQTVLKMRNITLKPTDKDKGE